MKRSRFLFTMLTTFCHCMDSLLPLLEHKCLMSPIVLIYSVIGDEYVHSYLHFNTHISNSQGYEEDANLQSISHSPSIQLYVSKGHGVTWCYSVPERIRRERNSFRSQGSTSVGCGQKNCDISNLHLSTGQKGLRSLSMSDSTI